MTDTQNSHDNEVLNEGTLDKANIESSGDNSNGNMGLNAASGDGNQQDNAAALALTSPPATSTCRKTTWPSPSPSPCPLVGSLVLRPPPNKRRITLSLTKTPRKPSKSRRLMAVFLQRAPS